MAQGFVKNLNLVESASELSDSGILNNLGGLGIADDLRIFDGNLRFKSRLVNDPNFLGIARDYGFLETTKKYKISILGDDRDWTQVGWVTGQHGVTGSSPDVGDIFVASESGITRDGEGGVATEVVGREDMTAQNLPDDGWTIFVSVFDAKRAFTDSTKLKVNDEAGYQHQVFNSDGVSRFQIKNIVSGQTLDLSNITTFSLVRDDSVLPENITNLIVKGQEVRGQVTDLEEDIDPYPDPFETQIPHIDNVISDIEYKKANVILTYQDNIFDYSSGVLFSGSISIENIPPNTVNTILVGSDTPFHKLIVGEKYRITALGTGANWNSVGASVVTADTPEVPSGNFVTTTGNNVYVIESLGIDARGTNGAFTFTTADMDGNSDEIDLGSGHGLVVGDKVRLTKDANDDTILGLAVNTDYFVHTVNGNEIKLSLSDGGSISTFDVPSSGDGYKLTIDVQNAWNTIAGTTGVTYTEGYQFVANTNGSGITNGVVYPIIFIATATGVATSTNGTAKALEAPGLYINNVMTGEANRAFTGKDNPWGAVQNKSISTSGPTLQLNALVTSSAIAQAGDFIFRRADETDFGSFNNGEHYTITDLGNSRDWASAGTYASGVTPAVGVSFEADAAADTSSGSGGKAIGQPKLLFTNTAQTSTDGDGLGDFGSSTNISGATITHKIPIYVNGEIYYLLAKSTPSDVAAGNYKILAKPSS